MIRKYGIYWKRHLALLRDGRLYLFINALMEPIRYLSVIFLGAIAYERMITGLEYHDKHQFLQGIVIYVVGFLLSVSAIIIAGYVSKKLTAIFRFHLRENTLRAWINVDLMQTHLQHSSDLFTRCDRDIDIVASLLGEKLIGFITPIIVSIVCLWGVLARSWIIGLTVFLSMVVVFVFHLRYGPLYKEKASAIQQSLDALTGHFADALRGALLIRVFNIERHMGEKTRHSAEDLYAKHMGYTLLKVRHVAWTSFFTYSSMMLPFILGAILTVRGTLTLPDIMYITQLSGNLLWLADGLANAIADIQRGIVSSDRLQEIADAPKESLAYGSVSARSSAIVDTAVIELVNVTVIYKDKTALRDVSMAINKGQRVAFVGESGSGKSTLFKTLLRFASFGGSIKVNGKDIYEYTLAGLRDIFSYVTQDIELLNISIRENIRLGKADATDEEVTDAAKKAHAYDFITKLPDGFDAMVGEGDMNLSRGECQRIAIARAILRDAPIILLDEISSALDPETERHVFTAFEDISRRGKTIISIVHNMKYLSDFDIIFLFRDKQVVRYDTLEDFILAHPGLHY